MDIRTETEISSAHFVGSTETPCKRLHGHNWKIEIEIEGSIQSNGMVMDFIKIKELFKKFDHKVLVPSKYNSGELPAVNYTIFEIDGMSYTMPVADVEYLDIPETTAEHMAALFSELLAIELVKTSDDGTVRVVVWETPKSCAEGFAVIDAGELYLD